MYANIVRYSYCTMSYQLGKWKHPLQTLVIHECWAWEFNHIQGSVKILSSGYGNGIQWNWQFSLIKNSIRPMSFIKRSFKHLSVQLNKSPMLSHTKQCDFTCTGWPCFVDSSSERGVAATCDGEVWEPGSGGGGQLWDGAQVSPQRDRSTGGHQKVPGERGW